MGEVSSVFLQTVTAINVKINVLDLYPSEIRRFGIECTD